MNAVPLLSSWHQTVSTLFGVLGLIALIAGIGLSLAYIRLSSRLSIVAVGFVMMFFLRIPQVLIPQLFRGTTGWVISVLLQILNLFAWAVVLGGLALVFSELQRRLNGMSSTPPGTPEQPNQPYGGYRPF